MFKIKGLAAFTFLLPLMVGGPLKAHELTLSGVYFPSFTPNRAFGFSAILNNKGEHYQFGSGVEFRTAPWGNQIMADIQLSRIFFDRGKSYLAVRSQLQTGAALIRERPLFIYAGGLYVDYKCQLSERWSLQSSIGIRQSICQGYRTYSKYYRVLEGAVQVGIGFRLRRLS